MLLPVRKWTCETGFTLLYSQGKGRGRSKAGIRLRLRHSFWFAILPNYWIQGPGEWRAKYPKSIKKPPPISGGGF
jgi:hypothetical protein